MAGKRDVRIFEEEVPHKLVFAKSEAWFAGLDFWPRPEGIAAAELTTEPEPEPEPEPAAVE